MRFFRIPSFTGIETHRDDADRGSLRVVEGCLPFGSGGLRSGPVWKNAGSVTLLSDSQENHLTASDDGNGNSALFVSRLGEVHDMMLSTTEHVEVSFFVSTYSVVDPLDLYRNARAVISPVGNRLFSFGDSDGEAVFIGKGPPTAEADVFPDETLYSYEWSRFPDCKFFVQGPKKTLFASGNPAKPLTIYISEPASKTSQYRDAPYSTENTNQHPGSMSSVDILGSNASIITALSTRGDQVVVHTDKGCHVLYAPTSDQAETGYRVEQAPATNFSAAVNPQVVGGESGTMSFWLGHDGQIYKDESASRGAEDKKSQADPDQASWKAKGVWEKELPVDLRYSFATYDPQSGMYWVYVLAPEYLKQIENNSPSIVTNLNAKPELPSLVTVLDATSVPGLVTGLDAKPVLPGLVSGINGVTEAVGLVTGLDAKPELPGLISNLVTVDLPGLISGLDAKPALPGLVGNINGVAGGVGLVTGLDAKPELPGLVSNINGIAGGVGLVTGLDAKPALPGLVSALNTLTEPALVSALNAKPELPGLVTNTNGIAGGVGLVSALDAKPELPGLVTNLVIPAQLEPPMLFVGNGDEELEQVSFWMSYDSNQKLEVNPGTNTSLYGTRSQISLNSDFSSPFSDTLNFISLISGPALSVGTDVYFRVKYESTSPIYLDSEWTEVTYTMPAVQLNAPSIGVEFTNLNSDPSTDFTTNGAGLDDDRATSYTLQWSANSNFSGASSSTGNSLVFVRSGVLIAGTLHYFRIKATAPGYTDSNWSDTVEYTTQAAGPLDTPSLTVASPSGFDPETEARAFWSESLGHFNYQIQVATDNTFSGSGLKIYIETLGGIETFDLVRDATNYPDSANYKFNLEADTTYYVRVRATAFRDGSGNYTTGKTDSAWSAIVEHSTSASAVTLPGLVSGLSAEAADTGLSCPVSQRFYWSWNINKLVDQDNNDFDLADTLFYTYVHPFKHAQTPWNGVHLSGGPFPNTQSIAQGYQGSGSADTNIFWGSSPTQKPYNGGRSISWNYSTQGSGSGTGPVYQMWHAFKPQGNDAEGMRKYSADYTGQGYSGSWNRNITTELFRNTATENMGINLKRGTVIDMSFVKSDNTDPCQLTGKYVEVNSGSYWIYVGLTPFSPGTNRMSAKHSNGQTFELYT